MSRTSAEDVRARPYRLFVIRRFTMNSLYFSVSERGVTREDPPRTETHLKSSPTRVAFSIRDVLTVSLQCDYHMVYIYPDLKSNSFVMVL
jgi:hypothetical protein